MDSHFDFLFKDKNIDVMIDDNGVAWFQGPQVASILGYSRSNDMNRMLNPNEAATHNVRIRSANGAEQMRKITMINEYGLYRLIALSRRSEAIQFQNWLYYQVLPSIRRYGAYIDSTTRQVLEADPNAIHDLGKQIAALQEQNALSEFSRNLSIERENQAAEDCHFYYHTTLFYQDLLDRIDEYTRQLPRQFQYPIWDILDEIKYVGPFDHDEKRLLYHVVDRNKCV